MKTKFQQSVAGFLLLAACSNNGPFTGSELTRNQVEILQRNDLVYMMSHPDTDDSFDGTAREAAFIMVKDMRAEQALTTFQIDGAICDGRTCVWTYRDRETLVELAYGFRPAGPRRTTDWFRSVTIEADIVADLEDLSVRHWYERVASRK